MFTDQPEDPSIALTDEEYHVSSLEFFAFVASNLIERFDVLSPANVKYKLHDLGKELSDSNDVEESKKIFAKIPYSYQEYMWDLWYARTFNIADTKKIEYLRALYDERIHQMDEELKHLLDLVNNPRMFNNTILIITADHGEEFGEHGFWGHASNLYDIQTQVPLIMHIPGVRPTKIKDLVQAIDIYPTVLKLIGVTPKSNLEGIDLTGLIKGDKNAITNKYILSEFDKQTTIRDKYYKLYLRSGIPSVELYEAKDKQEVDNIASWNPLKVSEFLGKLGLEYNKSANNIKN
jgi:arylsulfatase A-like enzyme